MSDALAECKTLSVPIAGKLYFDLSRNASYDAVKRGEIPVVKIGRKYRVPVAAMERLLDVADGGPKAG
jgi:excisionase family DNA binding protein